MSVVYKIFKVFQLMSVVYKIGLSAEMEAWWLALYTRRFFVFAFYITAQ